METLKKICSQLEDCVLGELAKDKTLIDAEELGEVVDAIKDIKMAIYYSSVTEAMEKYGEEDEKFYTSPRNSMGQYRRGYMYDPRMEESRDLDRNMGRMYYTDRNNMGSNSGYTESRYDRARRGYEEAKSMNPNMDNMEAMEQIFDTFEDDIKRMKSKMTPNEKAIAKSKLTNMSNMLM